jgi:hypothetical protein
MLLSFQALDIPELNKIEQPVKPDPDKYFFERPSSSDKKLPKLPALADSMCLLINFLGRLIIMAKWLRSFSSNYFPLTAVGSNPNRDFGFFHVRKLSSYPASLQNVGGSTQVPVRT